MKLHRTILLSLCFLASRATFASDVATHRVPDGGIQPQSVVDSAGVVHMIYYSGDPSGGDIFYVQSKDFGATFSKAIQVNSQRGSAIAMGNIRGAKLALGKGGRAHVAWMGSNTAAPRGPNKEAPMLYARLNDAGTAFESQRNLITARYGLDGGGTVAADTAGNVYVIWHGQGGEGVKGEENRRVWATHSKDEGKTFGPETAASPEGVGACACCGMSATTDTKGNVYAMFRPATGKTDRGMSLLVSRDKGASFSGLKLDNWNLDKCPMSSSTFTEGPSGMSTAWENNGQVFFTTLSQDLKPATPIPAPGNGRDRKHPAVATNAAGETLLAWTEGMGWAKGGTLAWQLYGKDGRPVGRPGSAPDVKKWSLVTAFARTDGGFTIVY